MSNIYTILSLIIIFILNISSSKSDDDEYPIYLKWQRELLESTCYHSPIICPMILAIEDIFKQIQKEEIKIVNNNCNSLCISYNNIHARDIICDNLTVLLTSSSAEIKFGNCNVLISGEIGYENNDYKSFNFGPFLSELKFSSISFNHFSNLEMIDLTYEKSEVKYKYDSSRSLFQSWREDLKEQMNDILEAVYEEYINKLKEKLEPSLEKEDILESTKKQLFDTFSYFKGGPNLFDEVKNVTYISYESLSTTYKDVIIIKNKIYFYNMVVNFQYALNYNVTFNDGYFIIRNVCFEGDENKKNNYFNVNVEEMIKVADFNSLKNSNEIWKVIINDFTTKFNEYKISKDNNNNRRFFY